MPQLNPPNPNRILNNNSKGFSNIINQFWFSYLLKVNISAHLKYIITQYTISTLDISNQLIEYSSYIPNTTF